MTRHLAISLNQAGPSSLDKGKARELVQSTRPPAWYPASGTTEDDEWKLEGGWWGVMSKDESYTESLPSVPRMASPITPRRVKIKRQREVTPPQNGSAEPGTPPLDPSKSVNLESVIHRNVNKLNEARKVMGMIHDWQRIETEGGVLPNMQAQEAEERSREKEEAEQRKAARRAEADEARKRRKSGGDVGEREAALAMKKSSAALLAHSGFEGANEVALDMFTKVATDHLFNLGRTFRLLLDGFSHKMTPEVSVEIHVHVSLDADIQEIVLHGLYENGQIRIQDLEAHIKDDLEREGGKISEMARKVRQAFKEVVSGAVSSVLSASTNFRQTRPSSRMTCCSTRTARCSQSGWFGPRCTGVTAY